MLGKERVLEDVFQGDEGERSHGEGPGTMICIYIILLNVLTLFVSNQRIPWWNNSQCSGHI
jgi:hypothetical protein